MIKLILSVLLAVSIFSPAFAQMCGLECTASEDGRQLIRTFEGYMPLPYDDGVGIQTVGFGHKILPGDKLRFPLLPADANKLLLADIAKHENDMHKCIKAPLQQNQWDALTSFVFNLGVPALRKSTLLKRVNVARHSDVPAELLRWNRAGGKVLIGLTRRRKAEAEIYSAQ